jgi:hypothetical protein
MKEAAAIGEQVLEQVLAQATQSIADHRERLAPLQIVTGRAGKSSR